jgi:succinate dehydrogenase hydrophobic anchor subunit
MFEAKQELVFICATTILALVSALVHAAVGLEL